MGSVCFSGNGTDGLLLDPKDFFNVGIYLHSQVLECCMRVVSG
jgi:hypothetical protein